MAKETERTHYAEYWKWRQVCPNGLLAVTSTERYASKWIGSGILACNTVSTIAVLLEILSSFPPYYSVQASDPLPV